MNCIKNLKFLYLIPFLFLSNVLFAEEQEKQVNFWQGFHSEMTPQDAADELNRMGLFKNKAKVNKMPRKPKYYVQGYNWIPVINSNRVKHKKKLQEIGMNLNGYLLQGPYFRFDIDDKLAEVHFNLQAIPNGTLSIGCSSPVEADGQQAFSYLSEALQNKYELKREDINYGQNSTSVRIFTDSQNETRVWLVMKVKYQKTPESVMWKCNRNVAKVTLHYADWQKIENKIENYEESAIEKSIDVL